MSIVGSGSDSPNPLSALAAGALLVGFAAVDPVAGTGGAVLLGACWAVLGPVPAFAVGQLVAAGLAPRTLPVLASLQVPLVAVLLTSASGAAAPGLLLAAAGVAVGAAGLVTVVAWLWTASLAAAALAALAALAAGLYAVYRYERVTVQPDPG